MKRLTHISQWANIFGWEYVRMEFGPWWWLLWLKWRHGGVWFDNNWLPPCLCYEAKESERKAAGL